MVLETAVKKGGREGKGAAIAVAAMVQQEKKKERKGIAALEHKSSLATAEKMGRRGKGGREGGSVQTVDL